MDQERVKKLTYRAWRRGFLEADLVLGPFAEAHLRDMTGEGLDEFERLLEQPDHDLYAWITEQAPTPEAFECSTLSLIKAFRYSAHAARQES
jgi:antitoxin CptB